MGVYFEIPVDVLQLTSLHVAVANVGGLKGKGIIFVIVI